MGMKSNKPSYLEYIAVQNRGYYKMTGVVNSNGKTFIELGYPYKKCIIDFLLLILCQTTIIIGLVCFIDLLIKLKFFKFAIVLILSTLVAPILMKLFRVLFGLRWIFTNFSLIELPEETKNKTHIYLEFYNNYVAFYVDRFILGKNKNKELDYTSMITSTHFGIFERLNQIYHFLVIITLIASILVISNYMSTLTVLIILYSSTVILYSISHIYAYYFWKRIKT